MLTHWAPIIHFTFEVTAAVLSQLTGPHTSKVQCSKIILLKLIVIFFLNLCLEYEVWSVMAQGSTYCSVTNGFLAAPSHDPYLILLNTLKRSCWWGSCCVILVASTPRWSLTWVWGELRIFQCPKSSLIYASIPRKRLGGGSSPLILWGLSIYRVLYWRGSGQKVLPLGRRLDILYPLFSMTYFFLFIFSRYAP